MVIGQQSWLEKYGGEKYRRGAAVVTAASAAPDKIDEVIKLLKSLQGSMPRGGSQYGAISTADAQAMVPFTPLAM